MAYAALTTDIVTPLVRYTFDETPQFTVAGPHGPLALAEGRLDAAARAWLEGHRAETFACFTACNPHSLALSPEANRQRHRALLRTLTREGLRYAEAECRQGSEALPAVVVFDIGPDFAAALGRAYAQGCVLHGGTDRARRVTCEALEFQI